MKARLEHANFSVSDAHKTAQWLQDIFGWHIRWEGPAMNGQGYTAHVGTDDAYVALYSDKSAAAGSESSYVTIGGLNHLAVVVDDLEATEAAVRAHGFAALNHADYDPGRRFYFHDHDGIEWEVVSYN